MVGRAWTPADCLFPLDEAYEYGMRATEDINGRIEGGCGCSPEDGGLISQAIRLAGDGDYLELGTFWGGSAILASLTKQKYGIAGGVYAIDDMTFRNETRTLAKVMGNFDLMGADVSLKVCKTFPFPYPDRKFNVVFIDAAHDLASCLQDWISVKTVSTKYVLFHDYTPGYWGVVSTVKVADFIPVHISGHTAVLQNIWGGVV